MVIGSFAAALLIAFGLDRILSRFPTAFGIPLALNLGIGTRSACSLAPCFTRHGLSVWPRAGRFSEANRPDLVPSLKESSNAPLQGIRGDWLRHFLVVVQVGFSMALLHGRHLRGSVWKAYSVDLGFRPGRLLFMAFDPPSQQYDAARSELFAQAALRRISTFPGIETATVAWDVPLTMMQSTTQVTDAESLRPRRSARPSLVGPDYFHTLGIALLAGRIHRG